ncbi:MAG: FkbM family methyltransferase [Candidatus Sericytochromatia bacterium]
MDFISYAQNYEDVMLWRALKHVEGGFYLDVGAWSPDEDSITKAFYERGWRGVNVEPNLDWHRALNEKRPEDVNLAVAVSDAPGEATFHFFANLGLSTMDEDVARMHMAEGWTAEPGTVTVTTLDRIWAEHVGDREVHFLKVDVEGLEERVLRGNDWTRRRPWIVVVESTRPMSQIESHEAWEPILTGAGYGFAYQDGLNRFYVAEEHAELAFALRSPPNVFDRFVRAEQHAAEQAAAAATARAEAAEAAAAEARAEAEAALARAAEAEARASELSARAAAAEAQASELTARVEALEARAEAAESRAHGAEIDLAGVLGSASWKLTRPLRWLKRPTTPMRLIR